MLVDASADDGALRQELSDQPRFQQRNHARKVDI
jgi:hypothetical protein